MFKSIETFCQSLTLLEYPPLWNKSKELGMDSWTA